MASGYSQNSTYEGNTIIGGPQALKLKESDGSKLINNYFSEPGIIQWVNSTRNVVTGNMGLEDASKVSVNEACFDETDEESLVDYLC